MGFLIHGWNAWFGAPDQFLIIIIILLELLRGVANSYKNDFFFLPTC